MSRRVVGNPIILTIDAVSIVLGLIGAHYVFVEIELPAHLSQAGPWQFLTNLSLLYSLVVFIVGLMAHVTKSQVLFEFKNNIHPIGLALESIVAVIYWPLRLFFIDLLIQPELGDLRLPITIDLLIHLMPVVSLLVDYLVFMPKWTIKTSTALILVITLTSGYWLLLKQLIDHENGAGYPYAFLDVDSEEKRLVVFAIVAGVAFTQFLFLKNIYDYVVKFTEVVDDQIDNELDKKNV